MLTIFHSTPLTGAQAHCVPATCIQSEQVQNTPRGRGVDGNERPHGLRGPDTVILQQFASDQGVQCQHDADYRQCVCFENFVRELRRHVAPDVVKEQSTRLSWAAWHCRVLHTRVTVFAIAAGCLSRQPARRLLAYQASEATLSIFSRFFGITRSSAHTCVAAV